MQQDNPTTAPEVTAPEDQELDEAAQNARESLDKAEAANERLKEAGHEGEPETADHGPGEA